MIVLDCSAAVQMYVDSAEGRALRCLMEEGERVLAPELYKVETANALWKYCNADVIGRDEALVALSYLHGCVDAFFPDGDLLGEAMVESVRLGHPVYDLLYFVLARRTNSILFTLDQRLQQVCLEGGVNVIFTDKEFGSRA